MNAAPPVVAVPQPQATWIVPPAGALPSVQQPQSYAPGASQKLGSTNGGLKR